ncbi:MAG: hypothetical protein JXR37_33035 [Kiritimatiellae bacterium]|nr:hypothetical protein [Kiritimatiellia bacterium]
MQDMLTDEYSAQAHVDASPARLARAWLWVGIACVLAATAALAVCFSRAACYPNTRACIYSPGHLAFEAIVIAAALFLVIDAAQAIRRASGPGSWSNACRYVRLLIGLGTAVVHIAVLLLGGYPS